MRDLAVLGGQLDLMILGVFSNLNDSMILYKIENVNKHQLISNEKLKCRKCQCNWHMLKRLPSWMN